jgi:tetratricopeptide (TPR) repeat protein
MSRGVIIPGVILVIAIIIYPKLFKRNSLEKLRTSGERISVAVMPFRNMTNDTLWNIWQDGIQFNLITSLSNSPELKVQESQSTYNLIQSKGFTNYASITPSVARTISQDLHANVFVYGSINQAGGNIRISAQLMDSKTQEIFKSFQIDGEFSKILGITDSLSSLIKSYLIISSLKKELTTDVGADMPTSVEAFKSFILGYKAFINYDHQSAVKWFLQAIKMDSSYYPSYVWLSISYANQGQYDKAEEWARTVYDKRDLLSFEMKIWVNWLSAKYIEKSIVEEIKYGKQLEELNDQVPITHWLVGLPYYYLKQYNNAIPELEATIRIYKSWNSKPMNGSFYETLISCYHETGRYKEEKDLLKKAIADFPNDLSLIRRQIIYSFNVNDTVTGNQYISKAVSLSKSLSKSDAEIAYGLADIYEATGKLDKAESIYRKALSMEPENVNMLNNLAFFLIDKDINVTEGMELISKAYKLNPAKTWYMEDTKAWGLHKLGRNEEALEILEKCWDMRPDFNYLLYSHLEEVKKAVANQK